MGLPSLFFIRHTLRMVGSRLMGAKKLKGARLILPLLCIVLIHAMGRGMRHWLRILKFCSGVVGENVKIIIAPLCAFFVQILRV